MSATLLGTVGVWGPGADEAGVIVSEIDFDYTAKEQELLTRQAEVQGLAIYDERVNITLDGEVPASSPSTDAVAGTLTLANSVDYAHLQASSGGANIVKGVRKRLPREGWQDFSFRATLHPFLTIV